VAIATLRQDLLEFLDLLGCVLVAHQDSIRSIHDNEILYPYESNQFIARGDHTVSAV
jgi:hypothetical protein